MNARLFVAALIVVLAAVPAGAGRAEAQTGSSTSVGAAAGGSAARAAETRTAVEDYRIGAEDVVEVSVWKNPELSRTVPVRPDGRISLPLLNDVQAASRTAMQLRDDLTKRYGEYLADAEVSVIVREINSIKVSVVGMVKTSGQYELTAGMTVLDALALAGGFDDFARKDQIVVLRRGPRGTTRHRFDYPRVIDGGQENYLLAAGDIVIVP